MSTNTSIEWTRGDDGSAGTTWNPVTGCTEASTGCANCYARGMSKRLAAMARADEDRGNNPGKKAHYKLSVLEDGRWSGIVSPVPSVLREPMGWKKPRRVFVNSMSDLFWGTPTDLKVARQRGVEDPQPVPFEFIDQVFAVMALCPQHTFQVLTKRPERMAEYFAQTPPWTAGPPVDYTQWRVNDAANTMTVPPDHDAVMNTPWPLPNVWLGTSVENRAAESRIEHLYRCPAAVHFVSAEPLLGELSAWWLHVAQVQRRLGLGYSAAKRLVDSLWVIVGGESGKGARPMHPDWARSVRDQCQAAGVPFFFKQWGEFVPYEQDAQPPFWTSQHGDYIDGHALPVNLSDRIGELTAGWLLDSEMDLYRRVGKKAAGRLLDGRTWDEFPAVEGVNHG